MIQPDVLRELPLLLDGSPGDWLRRTAPEGAAARPTDGTPVEALNLSQPERVRRVHAEFFAAGARALRTNTLGANALELARFGLAERCEAVNNTAAALVREVIGRRGLLLGSVGPLSGGAPGAPEPAHAADRDRAYGQQLVYLSDLGVDFLLLEGLERQEALRVRQLAREAGDAPALAVLALAPGTTALDGAALDTLRAWADGGMDALGLLAGPDAQDLRPLAEGALTLGLPLAIMLQDRLLQDRLLQDRLLQDSGLGRNGAATLTPADFAARLAPLATLGVMLLGGGAGIAPAHIRALGERLGRAAAPAAQEG